MMLLMKNSRAPSGVDMSRGLGDVLVELVLEVADRRLPAHVLGERRQVHAVRRLDHPDDLVLLHEHQRAEQRADLVAVVIPDRVVGAAVLVEQLAGRCRGSRA